MQHISKHVIPAESNQDWVATHLTKDGCLWGVCGDGHGAPRFPERRDLVEYLKDLDWPEFFESVEFHPGLALEAVIDEWAMNTIGIGACVCIFRVRDGVIDLWWRGDVMAMLYADGKRVSSTVRHSVGGHEGSVPVDGRSTVATWQVSIRSDSVMTMVPDARINLNPYANARQSPHAGINDECAVYNCLGHNKWAAGGWSQQRHTINPGVQTKLVLGSDGLWDMLTTAEQQHIDMCPSDSARSLAKLCAERWRQPWDYHWKGERVRAAQTIPNPDDVSCIVLSIGE